MNKNRESTKKVILIANLLSIAIVLNIIEMYVNIIPVPGAKIGFANIVTLITLYYFGFREALLLTALRSFIVFLLYRATFIPFMMGISGGILAVIVMFLLRKVKLHIVTVSVIGAISHSVGQVIMGIFLLETELLYLYLPLMLSIGIPAGILTGMIAKKFLEMFKPETLRDETIKSE